ncbi:hypothetical protein TUM17383_24370 [Shewanella algae]|nr:hypothetical protein TUM17383_24370 [Shewanella algae]
MALGIQANLQYRLTILAADNAVTDRIQHKADGFTSRSHFGIEFTEQGFEKLGLKFYAGRIQRQGAGANKQLVGLMYRISFIAKIALGQLQCAPLTTFGGKHSSALGNFGDSGSFSRSIEPRLRQSLIVVIIDYHKQTVGRAFARFTGGSFHQL